MISFNIQEAADFLKIKVATLRNKLSKKEGIPFHRVGRRLVFFKEELESFVTSGAAGTELRSYELAEGNRRIEAIRFRNRLFIDLPIDITELETLKKDEQENLQKAYDRLKAKLPVLQENQIYKEEF